MYKKSEPIQKNLICEASSKIIKEKSLRQLQNVLFYSLLAKSFLNEIRVKNVLRTTSLDISMKC